MTMMIIMFVIIMMINFCVCMNMCVCVCVCVFILWSSQGNRKRIVNVNGKKLGINFVAAAHHRAHHSHKTKNQPPLLSLLTCHTAQ